MLTLPDLPGTVYNTGEVRAVRGDRVWRIDFVTEGGRKQFGIDTLPEATPNVIEPCVRVCAAHADRYGRHPEERARIEKLARDAFAALEAAA